MTSHGPLHSGLDVLDRVPLFQGLDPAVLDSIRRNAALRDMRAGGTLFRQSDAPARLHVVASGWVKISMVDSAGGAFSVGFKGAGDVLACVAVVRRIPYPATATAVTEAAALVWPVGFMSGLLERDSRLAGNAARLIGTRTEEMLHRLREMATARVEQRLARALLRLGGGDGTDGPLAEIRLSRQDLAELVGTDLYTVSRCLRRWHTQGILEAGRQRIVLSDPRRLGRVASAR